jgi:hypothetical protein
MNHLANSGLGSASSRQDAQHIRLSDAEQRVLRELTREARPMTAIDLASRARLSVGETVEALQGLQFKGLVSELAVRDVDAEQIHADRYRVDDAALARAAG